MKLHFLHSLAVLDGVSLQNLQRNDKCVLQQICEDLCVEHVYGTIVASSCHQWVGLAEVDLREALAMVLESLVGSV